GFSLGEADTLRKAMGKKDRELMATQREKFISGCKASKIDGRKAERIWDLIEKFAGYGFNKCLTADTRIEMGDGSQKLITEVRAGDLVLTKDGPYRARAVRPSGVRPVGRLHLANGMSVRCTPDHPIFTQRGWVNAQELSTDDFVAVARELPCGSQTIPDHLPALLGYALSEGSLNYEGHFYLYSTSEDELEDMARSLALFANTVPRIERRPTPRASSVRPVRADRREPAGAVRFLFEDCGLKGRGALDKRVPSVVDAWDLRAIAILIAKLFQGDGCIHRDTRSVFYATSSEGLADDVRRLLLKLGLSSTVHRKEFAYRGTRRPGFTVNLLGGRVAYRWFEQVVGSHLVGRKREDLSGLVRDCPESSTLQARGPVDVVPVPLALGPVREAIAKTHGSLRAGCDALGISYRPLFADGRKRGIRRDTLRYLAERLDSPTLYALAESPIGWSRPRGFALEGEEATYDFEVPGAASFIANGIAVHNSHAACYGVVAYQTAYLKANYPTEFMAALLTSEMDKTDKIVQYVEETRAMGLRVEAPDVNVSRAQFTVAGESIHFGLGAIKNVGVTAIESIVKTREADGRFGTLEDFCARVDLRLVNRRVVECLIKAGAFDSLQSTRAGLLAGLDQAMESGQRRQRDREEGQVSLFDVLGGGDARPAAAPAAAARVPEWPQEEMLAYEREVLGFYLSGHPLEQYRDVARRIGALGASDLAARSTGARVLLLGQVSAFSESTTKSGNRMAFATLELVDGSVPLTIFPEPYRSCAGALRHKGPVIVRGRADDSEKGRVVLAEEIKPLEEAMGNAGPGAGNGHGNGNGSAAAAHACRIRVSAAAESLAELLASVKAACREHEGRTPLFLHVLLPEQEVVLRVKELGVDPAPDLVAKVEGLLGPGSILVEYAGRA
ncbi:MAG: LAGLIDADG family homing endonuclease, partial [Candidatus Rokuibacteriota bacterium]